MTNFAKNDFIQWTFTDEEGEYSYIGQIISCKDDRVEFATNGGVWNVPINDGTFHIVKRPKHWSVKLPIVVNKKEHNTKHVMNVQRTKTSDGSSKKDKAIDIYETLMDNGNHPQRANVINEFMSKLSMTKAGASTYQNACKKHFS